MPETPVPRVILDTSSLIVIAKAGALGDWFAMFGVLGIPPAVHEEAVVRGKAEGHEDATIIEAAIDRGWVMIVALTPEQLLFAQELRTKHPALDLSERQLIAAGKNAADSRLIVEDRKARTVARLHSLDCWLAITCPLDGYIANKITCERCLELLTRLGALMNAEPAIVTALRSAAEALHKERSEKNG